MKTYRSQYWYKDKTWFSDFVILNDWDNTCNNRVKEDAKNFALNSGLSLNKARRMLLGNLAGIEEVSSKKFMDRSGWRMIDLGEVTSCGFNELVVMS